MLLALVKDEYLPTLDALRGDDEFAHFVSLLGETLVQGDHALSAAPLLLEQLAGWDGLSRSQAEAFRETARAMILRELPFDTVTHGLVLTGPAGVTQDPDGGTDWRRRDWKWLLAKGRLPRTCLGGENGDDALWYAWLGRAHGVKARPQAINAGNEVQVRPRGLGGSTAGPELYLEAIHGDPVLCILDSDKEHPSASLGDTASHALRARDALERDGKQPLVHIELLQARDVENLLPRKVVADVADTGSAWYEPMLRRGFFVDAQPVPALRYIDIGKDQCERRLLDTKDPATLNYRRLAISVLRTIDPTCRGGAQSQHPEACIVACGNATGPKKWADMDSSCYMAHSVGKLLLPSVVRHIAEQDKPGKVGGARWLEARLPNDPALLEPAAIVWSWGLSLPKRLRNA